MCCTWLAGECAYVSCLGHICLPQSGSRVWSAIEGTCALPILPQAACRGGTSLQKCVTVGTKLGYMGHSHEFLSIHFSQSKVASEIFLSYIFEVNFRVLLLKENCLRMSKGIKQASVHSGKWNCPGLGGVGGSTHHKKNIMHSWKIWGWNNFQNSKQQSRCKLL